MRRFATRWYWIIGWSLVVVLVSAGCFQQAGSGLDAEAFSADVPTFTPFPSETPIPSATPIPLPTVTDVFLPTVVQDVIVTPTDAAFVQPLTLATDVPLIAQAPTDAGGAQLLVPDQQFNQPAAQDVQPLQIDPLMLTATSIIAGATQTVAFQQTSTAQAVFGQPIFTATLPQAFLPTFTPVPQTGPFPTGTDCVHEVRAGDRNLYRISLVYGVTVNDIATASGIVNPDLIYVGDRLIIPGCGTTGAFPPATSTAAAGAGAGDTITTANVVSGSAGGVRHVVQQGETLFEISQRYGVLVNTIASANGISNIDLIYINQELVIP